MRCRPLSCPPLFHGDAAADAVGGNLLNRVEALELGVAERHGLGSRAAGPGMRLAEGFRFGPALEGGVRRPYGVRRVKHVIRALRALEKMEGHEAGKLVQVALAGKPDVLEVR